MFNIRKSRLGRVFDDSISAFGAAVSVAAASGSRRPPADHALEALGIDPDTYPDRRRR